MSGRTDPAPRRKAAILVASTRAAAGIYQDEAGPLLQDWLYSRGYDVVLAEVVPDGEEVGAALRRMLALQPSVLMTSGGTGILSLIHI